MEKIKEKKLQSRDVISKLKEDDIEILNKFGYKLNDRQVSFINRNTRININPQHEQCDRLITKCEYYEQYVINMRESNYISNYNIKSNDKYSSKNLINRRNYDYFEKKLNTLRDKLNDVNKKEKHSEYERKILNIEKEKKRYLASSKYDKDGNIKQPPTEKQIRENIDQCFNDLIYKVFFAKTHSSKKQGSLSDLLRYIYVDYYSISNNHTDPSLYKNLVTYDYEDIKKTNHLIIRCNRSEFIEFDAKTDFYLDKVNLEVDGGRDEESYKMIEELKSFNKTKYIKIDMDTIKNIMPRIGKQNKNSFCEWDIINTKGTIEKMITYTNENIISIIQQLIKLYISSKKTNDMSYQIGDKIKKSINTINLGNYDEELKNIFHQITKLFGDRNMDNCVNYDNDAQYNEYNEKNKNKSNFVKKTNFYITIFDIQEQLKELKRNNNIN